MKKAYTHRAPTDHSIAVCHLDPNASGELDRIRRIGAGCAEPEHQAKSCTHPSSRGGRCPHQRAGAPEPLSHVVHHTDMPRRAARSVNVAMNRLPFRFCVFRRALVKSESHWWMVLLLAALAACPASQSRPLARAPPSQSSDLVFFVHYYSAVIPLACYKAMERRFARGAHCLSLVPPTAPILVEAAGPLPARPFSEVCYEQPVPGLAVEKSKLPANGYSVWPPQGARRVKRLTASWAYLGGGDNVPWNIEGPAPDPGPPLTSSEKALLAQAGRKALAVPNGYELYIRQVVSVDLDHVGRNKRLVALGFHQPLGPEPTNDELRDSSKSLLFYAGIFLLDDKAGSQVQLLRLDTHTILATVDLAGDDRIALWLDGSDTENLYYSLELFQKGQLLPLGCFGCGPGNGLTTSCTRAEE